MLRKIVGHSHEVPPGSMIHTSLGPLPVVVVRTRSGELRAYADRCLHMGGQLSRGVLEWSSISSTDVGEYRVERDGEILRCPWHGWQYDVETGATVFDASRKLRKFQISDIDGEIVLEV